MVDRGTFSKMNQDLSFVDEKVRTFAPVSQSRCLPVDFQPNHWTVICGRGKTSYNWIANRRFRILCEINQPKYENATSKTEKSLIVMNIVDAIREGSGNGGFVKQDPYTHEWFEVSDSVAREKVGQQLRENLSKKGGSSKQSSAAKSAAKKRKRTQESNSSVVSQTGTTERRISVASNTSSCGSTSSELAVINVQQQADTSDLSGDDESERSSKSRRSVVQSSATVTTDKVATRQISPVSIADDIIEWDAVPADALMAEVVVGNQAPLTDVFAV